MTADRIDTREGDPRVDYLVSLDDRLRLLDNATDCLMRSRRLVTAHEDAWREAIRSALADGSSATDIARVAGISRARVYQIRDGRR